MASTKDQEARRFSIDQHAGDQILHQLKAADRATELLPLLGIADRRLYAALANPHTTGCNTVAAVIQSGHGDFKAVTHLAQQLIRRNAAVLEDELASIGSAQTKLAMHVAGGKPRGATLYEKGPNTTMPLTLISLCEDDRQASHSPIGNPNFMPIKPPMIALGHSSRFHPGRITSGIWL